MEITEVRIKLMEDSEDRLRAFCSVTFDHSFVVRDLKIIEGANGPFVAMPSRKMSARCGRCGCKNHLRSHYCNQCGSRLRGLQDLKDVEGGPNKLYADIAHPINQACRDMIQNAVVREYTLELERAKQPGYVSRYDEEYIDTTPQSPPQTPTVSVQVDVAPVSRPHFLGTKPAKTSSAASPQKEPKGFGDGVFE
jgi:stage V sporulation protein G